MDKNSNFQEIVERAMAIRQQYHQLERELHQEEWNLIEDALAFMTDASLVGRNIMSISNSWPNQDDKNILRHKIGECIWWLIVKKTTQSLTKNEYHIPCSFKTLDK